MRIIDELKQLARKRQKDQGQDSEDVIQFTQANLLSQLQKIHNFLRELVEQLYAAEPDILVSLPVRDIGICHNLRQSDYKLLAESKEQAEVISLMCSLQTEQPCKLPVVNLEKLGEVTTELAEQGLNAALMTQPNEQAYLEISGNVPVTLNLEIDKEAALIRLRLRNFNQLGLNNYYVKPEQVNEQFLEILGEFILRENNDLMEVLQQSKSGLLRIQDVEVNAPKTEEMDTSRMRSLFNQEAKIYLTYHNTIKELNSKTEKFVLGRSRDCDMIINSDLASRHHASILYRKGKFVLIDQSTNGTFIKAQGGKEIYLQREELPLSGSGFISLGKSVSVDNEHLVYFSCQ